MTILLTSTKWFQVTFKYFQASKNKKRKKSALNFGKDRKQLKSVLNE